jgi:hypothetical protein
MSDELKQLIIRAKLKAILEHELREEGRHEAISHIEVVPRLGYLIVIGYGDNLTIRRRSKSTSEDAGGRVPI